MFRTVDSQSRFRSDNSCVGAEFKERGDALRVTNAYGIIKTMFLHRLGQGEEEIFVECDWYEELGLNPRTKLSQVRRNPNFDRCRVDFLKNLKPLNLVLWPSDCHDPGNGLLDVILHHE